MFQFTTHVRRRLSLIAASAIFVASVVSLAQSGLAIASAAKPHQTKPTIVLVHGDWADGSSWSKVVKRLQREGYTVVAPPNPLRQPTADIAYLSSYLSTIAGPIVLVGHSYGGFIITNVATGNANVQALVYIDAFIPNENDTLGAISATFVGSCLDPATAFNAVPISGDVDLYLRTEANGSYPGFAECFANGVKHDDIGALAAAQRPAAVSQLSDPSGPPAWKTLPSWALIGTADHVIPPAAQRAMATNAGSHITTVNAGHLGLVSRPDAVVAIIDSAVRATS